MNLIATDLPGCFIIAPQLRQDARGSFVKVFQASVFHNASIPTGFTEEYYSTSKQGVLRGMHFQIPPKQHWKLVYCVHGKILDVMLDLRVGSPTYGRSMATQLDGDSGRAAILPPGIAHGFHVASASATVVYKVTSEYAPQHDKGVLWNSFGQLWPDRDPLISERDAAFPAFKDFVSPFRYSSEGAI
jgi:dTDP-4-dehydrorhamnose 3,5-epimerase